MIQQYRQGATNHCPGCGRTHWLIGRMTAECAFCHTAVMLAEQPAQAARPMLKMGKGGGKISRTLPAWAA